MSYRPEGFNNPYPEGADIPQNRIGNMLHAAFEAGVDEYERCLRRKSLFHVFSGGDNSSGDIVFIPEEVEVVSETT